MADLQSTNRTKTSKVRETSFGVTPTNPAFKTLRTTSSSLNFNPQTVITDEIRSDRQITDLIMVGQNAQGDIGAELSFQTQDDDFEEALQGTWANQPRILVVTSDTEISDVSTTALTVASGGAAFKAAMLVLTEGFGTAGNNKLSRVSSSTGTTITFPSSTFTAESTVPVGASARVVGFEGASGDLVAVTSGGNALTSTSLDFTTLGLLAGDWIKLGSGVAGTGFATTANNGWCRVSAVAAGRLSFSIVPTGWTADAGTGITLRAFMGDRLRNSSTKRSNTFERQYLDHSPVSYEYMTGMVLNTMNVEFKSKSITKVTCGYMGQGGDVTTTRLSGATDVAAPTTEVMNTSSNVGDLSYDGAPITGPNFVMSATMEITNNLRMQDAVGSKLAVGVGNGEFGVTGSLQSYFGTPAVLQKVLNNGRTSYSTRVGYATGNKETLLFDLPSIKMSAGAPSISGKNADVMLDGKYQGLMDPTLGYTMAIQRYWYTA